MRTQVRRRGRAVTRREWGTEEQATSEQAMQSDPPVGLSVELLGMDPGVDYAQVMRLCRLHCAPAASGAVRRIPAPQAGDGGVWAVTRGHLRLGAAGVLLDMGAVGLAGAIVQAVMEGREREKGGGGRVVACVEIN